METVKFTELDIKPEILKAVANMGFEAMSPIQAKAIPVTYLSYSIGYYELNKLEKEMAASLGKSFKISDFHEAVLNVGSCNFAILSQEIEKETEILSKVP